MTAIFHTQTQLKAPAHYSWSDWSDQKKEGEEKKEGGMQRGGGGGGLKGSSAVSQLGNEI